ncbi:hypothetical protein [Terrimonas alba]|uniref:hypothetical protein n=1 Tax=Terrimonas alba TaxID=3349636 RepID=UPI0035F31073
MKKNNAAYADLLSVDPVDPGSSLMPSSAVTRRDDDALLFILNMNVPNFLNF